MTSPFLQWYTASWFKTKLNKPSFLLRAPTETQDLQKLHAGLAQLLMHYAFKSLQSPHAYPAGNWRGKHLSNHCNPWCKALHHVLYTSSVSRREATPWALLQKEASQRQQRAQRLQRRSVAPASQRRRVAALRRPPERRSVAAPPSPGASQRNVGNPRFGPLCPCNVIF